MQWPSERIFKKSVRTLKKIEVKGGRLVKKWEFGQTKKKSLYKFFKTRICAFMTYGQFPPRSSSSLKFVIRYSRLRDPQPRPRIFKIYLCSVFAPEEWIYSKDNNETQKPATDNSNLLSFPLPLSSPWAEWCAKKLSNHHH